MAGSNEVLLARHGETDDNLADRFQGQLDPPLNERGREQAHELARTVAGEGVVAVFASPLRRARETAEIVGAQLGLEPVFDARLMEANAGDWSGVLYTDITAASPGEFERWRAAEPAFRFPGGESVTEQIERVTAALADIGASGRLPALVVCHGGTIRAALGVSEVIGNGVVKRLRIDGGKLA